jgi:hypothetical protein
MIIPYELLAAGKIVRSLFTFQAAAREMPLGL